MDGQYTAEQLNNLNREELVSLVLSMQEKTLSMDQKLQLILEQLAVQKHDRFGQSSEKLLTPGQLRFLESDGQIFINEAEAVVDAEEPEEEPAPPRKRTPRPKGKRAEDLSHLPTIPISHEMTEEELSAEFGDHHYRRLPDEIYHRLRFTPAKVEREEHHVAVYADTKDSSHIVKAPHPTTLLANSLASPSIVSGVINAKYVNGVPLYRQEQEMSRQGIPISRQDMASWVIRCGDRYLKPVYDYLHQKLYDYHVLQADETPFLVNKDGRDAGTKSYMWVYRTGKYYRERPIVLYEYQATRRADHPKEFLRDFHGICVTDGYQVYHTVEGMLKDLTIAGCWSHARRKFTESEQALPKNKRGHSIAHKALLQIQAIYREEDKLKDLPAEERKTVRQLTVKPLVDAYFAWVKQEMPKTLTGSKTYKGMQYSLNQEAYLRVFLTDGDIPIDNNTAEQTIRPFCVGKKNWVMIDTVSGARVSAVIYSLVETAKANDINPYEYFNYLLEEIPRHQMYGDTAYLEDLMQWSDKLPDSCKTRRISKINAAD